MSLPRLHHTTHIADRLTELESKVKVRSRASLTDANHILEVISKRFFNALFGWELVNLNLEQENFPAADLGDRARRLAIQITNQESGEKITDTAAKADKHKLGEDFNRLIVFFLLSRKPAFPKKFTQPAKGPQIETWDIADLLKQMQEMEDLAALAIMQNKLPSAVISLCSRAEDMAVGCHNLQATLGIEHNTEAVIRGVLTPACTAENAYQSARGTKTLAVSTQRTASVSAKAFIMLTVSVLQPRLGRKWSPLWTEVGFVHGSLAVPNKISDRLGLLTAIKLYLAAHPTYEADQVGMTADAADDRHIILQNAHNTVNACRADTGVKKGLRRTAVKNLGKRMRGLILELKDVLPGDDARWHQFGLNMPAAVGIPAVPEDLVVTGGGPGHLLATWGNAALSDRYNVYRKIIGVDPDYVLVKTVTDHETDLNSMTSGQVVRVRVSSVNDAGESLLSDPVERVVP